jgi:phage terminase large subunit-like protein
MEIVRSRSQLHRSGPQQKRLEYPELKTQVISHARDWRAKNVLIEDKASGTHSSRIFREMALRCNEDTPSLDKVTRMQAVT